MKTGKTVEILKQAILLEKRGYSFYSKVAEQCTDPDIRNIFTIMADEETAHIRYLSDQFSHYDKNHSFLKIKFPDPSRESIANMVLSDDIRNKITAAGFEAAAISAAIDMENRSVEIYVKQAESAEDPNEKELFSWLAGWERSHLKLLSELDNELKEKIWFDNQFWPF
ncbi:MAG: ferritin family protein [Bacteroidota bacterium]|nr:ferritin family protein [Bacteroidota bacterium]